MVNKSYENRNGLIPHKVFRWCFKYYDKKDVLKKLGYNKYATNLEQILHSPGEHLTLHQLEVLAGISNIPLYEIIELCRGLKSKHIDTPPSKWFEI